MFKTPTCSDPTPHALHALFYRWHLFAHRCPRHSRLALSSFNNPSAPTLPHNAWRKVEVSSRRLVHVDETKLEWILRKRRDSGRRETRVGNEDDEGKHTLAEQAEYDGTYLPLSPFLPAPPSTSPSSTPHTLVFPTTLVPPRMCGPTTPCIRPPILPSASPQILTLPPLTPHTLATQCARPPPAIPSVL